MSRGISVRELHLIEATKYPGGFGEFRRGEKIREDNFPGFDGLFGAIDHPSYDLPVFNSLEHLFSRQHVRLPVIGQVGGSVLSKPQDW
jgi:hypothetical protein